MAAEADSFRLLMLRLRAGDDQAASAVFQRFARRLIGLARKHLDVSLRGKVDADDVLQSVLRSFFARHAREAYTLDTWDGLWGLLATITVRKCARKQRYFRQERRDVRRELPLQEAPADASWSPRDFQDLEPTPAQAAALAELVEQILRSQDQRGRQIIELTLQGSTSAEVSAEVGCTQRTVQRVLDRLRRELHRRAIEDDDVAEADVNSDHTVPGNGFQARRVVE